MIRMRNILLLLLVTAAELVHASYSSLSPIVTKSSRRLQAPIVAECNAQLILNAEDGTTVTTDVVLNFINGFFGAEYESFDVLHIRIQLAFFFQSGMDRTIEVNEGDENGVSLISIFCNDLAELFTEGGLLAPSASPTKPSLPTTISTPTSTPTASPTKQPSPSPTASPTRNPTPAPTAAPTKRPTLTPTASPTKIPTFITPTDSCMDEPNWVDLFGDGCGFYEENDACDLLGDCCENDGYTANTACCYCQGLSPSVTPAPLLSPTVLFVPTASPTTTCDEDENWTDRFGDGCDWYRLYDPECSLFSGCCGNLNTGLTSGDVCCHCQGIDPAPTLLFKTGIPTITPTVSFTPTYLPSMKPSLDPTTSIYPTLTFTPTYFPSTKQSLDPTNVINSNSNDESKSSSDDIEDILADYHIGAVVIGVGVIVMVYMIAMGKLGGLKEDKDNGESGTSQSFDKVEMEEGYTIRDLDEHTTKSDPAQNANNVMTNLSAMTTETSLVRDSTPPGLSDNQDNPKLSSPQASATNISVKFDEFDESNDDLGLRTNNELVRAVDLGQWTELSALADSLGLDDTPGGFSEEDERYEMSQDAFTRYKSAGQMVDEEPASMTELDKNDEEQKQKLQEEGDDNDDSMNFKATNPKNDFQTLEEYEGNEEDDDDEMLNMMPPIVSGQLTNQKDEEQLHMKAMSTLTNSASFDENFYTTNSNEIPSYDIILSSHSGDGESNADRIQNPSIDRDTKREVEEAKVSYDNEKEPIYKVDSYDNESIDGTVSEVDEETTKRRAELYTLLNSAHPNNSREENEKLMNNTINQGPEAEVDLLNSLAVMVKMMERESGSASKSPTNEISGGYSVRSTRSDTTGFETFD